MTNRLYFVPIIRRGRPVYRIPKYFWHPRSGYEGLAELEGVQHSHQLNHKLEDLFLLVADLDTTQEAALTAQADVIQIPADLDNQIPNVIVRDIVRSFLENVFIPAQWVTVGMTYRTILRVVIGLWRFRERLQHFVGVALFAAQIDLDKTVSEMPIKIQTALADAADALYLDYSGVTGSTTIRQLLYGAGQQFASIEFRLGPITI